MNYYEPEDVPECASCEQAQKDYAELEREVERWKKAAEANIEENVRLRREAHTWSKACEAATTKLHKLRTFHPRLEVRYWTGEFWEMLYGPRFDAVLDALDPTPARDIEKAAQITAEEHDALICDATRYRWLRYNFGCAIAILGFGPRPMRGFRDEELDALIDAQLGEPAKHPKFSNVSCSQCGRDFGPGDHGFSHCEHHR
jgi:hypothetical protein